MNKITNSNTLSTLPEEIVRKIFTLTIEKGKVSYVGRIGTTCTTFRKFSCRFLLDRIVQWKPHFSWVRNIMGCIPGGCEEVTFYDSQYRLSRSTFTNLIRDGGIDYLLPGVLAPLGESNVTKRLDSSFLIAILNLDLIAANPCYINIIVDKILARTQDSNPWLGAFLGNILSTMIELKLISKEAPYFDALINFIMEKVRGHFFVYIFESMFKQGLLTEDIKYFSRILKEAKSIRPTISDPNAYEEIQIKVHLLQICKISKLLQNTILSKFNITVATAIVQELFIEMQPKDRDSNLSLIKTIIDSEPSVSSECCQAIIDSLKYARTRVHSFLSNIEEKMKGIQELEDYIRNKKCFV